MGLEKVLSIVAAGLFLAGCSTSGSAARYVPCKLDTVYVDAGKNKPVSSGSVSSRPVSSGSESSDPLYSRYFSSKRVSKRINGNRLVYSCFAIPPRSLGFILNNLSFVEYRYGIMPESYLLKYAGLLKLDTDDKLYLMCLRADKNKDRIIDIYEAKDLYRSICPSKRQ